MLREREEQRARENAELQSRLAELEKTRASAEVELRSVNVRYEQLVKAQNSVKEQQQSARINNHQAAASLEQVKSKTKSGLRYRE